MEKEINKPIPNLLEMSLYESFELIDYSYLQLIQILTFSEKDTNEYSISSLDSYCIKCQKSTTFKSQNSSIEIINKVYSQKSACEEYNKHSCEWEFNYTSFFTTLNDIEIFTRSFYCPRLPNDKSHNVVIVLRVSEGKLTKIGQFPQLANLENSHLKKYKDLDKEIYLELNRATGLNSHGIGVGSFVYLRRIIEKYIVYPEIEKLIKDEILTKDQVSMADFKGKVILAKDHLSSILVGNTRIYSILSKGIHSLSEKECLEIFNPLLTAIELILDEQLEKVEREKKIARMHIELNKIK